MPPRTGAIADRLGMASSTVQAVLVRCRINRLIHIDRATGEPIRRHKHEQPGDLIHVDVKKLGKIPDGGGWRYDDHSRVAYVEAREDETKETAAAVLTNAVAWFADRGVPSSA